MIDYVESILNLYLCNPRDIVQKLTRSLYVKIGRPFRFFVQRRIRGWDDSETWNLDFHISAYIAPRLKRYKEISVTVPSGIRGNTFEEQRKNWHAILDEMIEGFEIHANGGDLWDQEVSDKLTRSALS